MLDIFFEALNYEAIEQKKAYNLAGLLGEWMCSATPLLATGSEAKQVLRREAGRRVRGKTLRSA